MVYMEMIVCGILLPLIVYKICLARHFFADSGPLKALVLVVFFYLLIGRMLMNLVEFLPEMPIHNIETENVLIPFWYFFVLVLSLLGAKRYLRNVEDTPEYQVANFNLSVRMELKKEILWLPIAMAFFIGAFLVGAITLGSLVLFLGYMTFF